jgi:hypothetical protein
MVVAVRLRSGCCLVRFLSSNLFISGIYYYVRCKVFGSLKVYLISGFCTCFICIGFTLFIVLWGITHSGFFQLLAGKEPPCDGLRLNKLAESIVSLQTRLLRPSTNFRPFLQCILHSSHVVDNAQEDPFPFLRIFMLKDVHLRQLAT